MSTTPSESMTPRPASPGSSTATSSHRPTTQKRFSTSEPDSAAITSQKPSSPSLYSTVEFFSEVNGELCIALDLLDSEDEADREVGQEMLDNYFAAQGLVDQKVDACLHVAAELEARAKFREERAKQEAERLKKLAASDKNAAKRLKEASVKALDIAHPGQTKWELPEHKVSLRKAPPSVEVFDQDQLPSDYIRVKCEPDKTAIKAALKAGEEVPGARLADPTTSIQVR